MSTITRIVAIPNPFVHDDANVSKILQIFCQYLKCIVPFAFFVSVVDIDDKSQIPHCEAVMADIEASYEKTKCLRATDGESVDRVQHVPCLKVQLAACAQRSDGNSVGSGDKGVRSILPSGTQTTFQTDCWNTMSVVNID